MLAVTLLVESDKTLSQDSFARIRVTGYASHQLVLQEVGHITDNVLKSKIGDLLALAHNYGI